MSHSPIKRLASGMSFVELPPFPSVSWKHILASLGEDAAETMLRDAGYDDETATLLDSDWRFIGRREQLPPEGSWVLWLVLAGRGFGKLLDAKTPLPTPTGWTTMGEVAVGDELFDEAGRVCRVTAKFNPPVTQAYKITFSDGAEIIADGDHQWVTWTHAERKAFLRSPYEDTTAFPAEWPRWRLRRKLGRQLPEAIVNAALILSDNGMSARAIGRQMGVSRQALAPHLRAGVFVGREPVVHDDSPGPRIRTTDELRRTLYYGARGDRNHCIPCAGALDLPDADLPIPPYTLGAWLGDGHSAGGSFTAAEDDQSHFRAMLRNDGFDAGAAYGAKDQTFGVSGLHVLLRRNDLLRNKHVPARYLRASARQRLALLRGLMDTDGNIENNNTVAFVNTNRALIDGVVELVHSLGIKCTVSTGVGVLNGERKSRYWRVIFRPQVNPFTLPRKARQLSFGGAQALRSRHRMIVGIEPVEPVEMYCVTVDSPNSMYLCGREMIPTHNTRSGAEWMIDGHRTDPEGFKMTAIVGATIDDVRKYCVDGESGIMTIAPDDFRPIHKKGAKELHWPNGTMTAYYSAKSPERLRGPNHTKAWCDELASWEFLEETWDNLEFTLRKSETPQVCITTTPKPRKLLRDIVMDPMARVTRGSTFDNAENVSAKFLQRMRQKYEGTATGRQELYAELLEQAEGALWERAWIDETRVDVSDYPDLNRIVVAVDPAAKGTEESDETGIVVCGVASNGHGYLIEDRSARMSPYRWGKLAVQLFDKYGANVIVAESNNGGEMVDLTIQSAAKDMAQAGDRMHKSANVQLVHASLGKQARAEPVAALYEQKRIHHVGKFNALEDQLCTWEPNSGDKSPDRLDAIVWAFTHLMVDNIAESRGLDMSKAIVGRRLISSEPDWEVWN